MKDAVAHWINGVPCANGSGQGGKCVFTAYFAKGIGPSKQCTRAIKERRTMKSHWKCAKNKNF